MSHTQLPWRVEGPKHEGYAASVMGSDGQLVVNLGDGGNGRETQFANAALIAAAPELLEAAQALYASMLHTSRRSECDMSYVAQLNRLGNLIARATGAQP